MFIRVQNDQLIKQNTQIIEQNEQIIQLLHEMVVKRESYAEPPRVKKRRGRPPKVRSG